MLSVDVSAWWLTPKSNDYIAHLYIDTRQCGNVSIHCQNGYIVDKL